MATFQIRKADIITGAIFYTAGDTIAALITSEFSWLRFGGMILIGGLLYAWEVPIAFGLINRVTKKMSGLRASLSRMFLAQLYFNPIWIARHILMIKLLMLQFDQMNISILRISCFSFLFNIPLSLSANYVIQNIIPERHRFLANAIFSGLMAIYYALSAGWF